MTGTTNQDEIGYEWEYSSYLLPFQWADERTLEEIDRALTLVQGSFLAASKLLSMEQQKLRSLVRYHPALKTKWGKPHGGRPKALGFRVQPYVSPPHEARRFARHGQNFVKGMIGFLSENERQEVLQWLQSEAGRDRTMAGPL